MDQLPPPSTEPHSTSQAIENPEEFDIMIKISIILTAGARLLLKSLLFDLTNAMLRGLHTSKKAELILLNKILYWLNELRLVYGRKGGNSEAGWYWGLQGQQQTSIQFIVAIL